MNTPVKEHLVTSEWLGITHYVPMWLLSLWKRIFCKRGWHLWDEVGSEVHYLYCDACDMTIRFNASEDNPLVEQALHWVGNLYYADMKQVNEEIRKLTVDGPIRGNVYPAKEYEAMYDALHEDTLGYTDTRRNINVALEIICGPDGIPL